MPTHPNCDRPNGHVCQRPSGDECIEIDCHEPAGTRWGPHWCPEHDAERLDRITAQLEDLAKWGGLTERSPKGH